MQRSGAGAWLSSVQAPAASCKLINLIRTHQRDLVRTFAPSKTVPLTVVLGRLMADGLAKYSPVPRPTSHVPRPTSHSPTSHMHVSQADPSSRDQAFPHYVTMCYVLYFICHYHACHVSRTCKGLLRTIHRCTVVHYVHDHDMNVMSCRCQMSDVRCMMYGTCRLKLKPK